MDMGKLLLGRKLSDKHIQKIKEGHTGLVGYWKGKKFSEETKNKISKSLKITHEKQGYNSNVELGFDLERL